MHEYTKAGYQLQTIEDAYQCITTLQQEGRLLKQQLAHDTEKLEQLMKQAQQLVQQMENVQQQYMELQQTTERQQRFHCDKIAGDCPYVEAIK
ncbi:MAG: hypothetical protein H6765_03315 [Candidatus Peribacteria bacterium]|nr:MAG: hypothetical protein H6765_03315 [Candidatus Peribacteria bacterium]